MPRTGRRSGEADTRSIILESARSAFAADGYRATIRQIADSASVDPALVMHYFENKKRLYLESIHIPVDPSMLMTALTTGPHADIGARLTRMFFTIWDVESTREPLLAILKGAIGGHDPGMDAFRGFVTSALLPAIAGEVHERDQTMRAELAVAQLIGVAVMRYVAHIEPIASADIDEIIEIVAPRVQSYFD